MVSSHRTGVWSDAEHSGMWRAVTSVTSHANLGDTAAAICKEAFANGLVIETSGNHSQVVKCLCPLTITEEQLLEGFEILDRGLAITDSAYEEA